MLGSVGGPKHSTSICGMDVTFNSIVVLQSLREEDRQTGREMQSVINTALLSKGQDGFAQLYNLTSKNELVFMLLSMKQQAIDDGLKPLIHFEIHGDENGFEMSNRDLVSWFDIKEIIRDINIATRNNLFISLATCYGGYFLQIFDINKPCPFFGYIGMKEIAYELDLEFSFTAFFQTLLTGGTFLEAIAAMKREVPSNAHNLSYINCNQFYNWIIQENAKMMADEAYKRRWLNLMYLDAKARFPHLKDETIYLTLNNGLNNGIYDKYFAECKKIFFHETLNHPSTTLTVRR